MKLSELLIKLIPSRIERHRLRGMKRYGFSKSLACRKEISKCDKEPENFLSICAIAKNEGPYFKEWLDWHIGQGVDKFYIYDNDSTDNTKEVLQPYIDSGRVIYHVFPGPQCQMPAYDKCIETYRFDTKWLAFLDIDEFVYPIKTPSFRSFLEQYDDAPAIEINWLNYGSGGATTKTPGGVMERFKHHSLPSHKINRHVKSVVNPRKVYVMANAQEATCIRGRAIDSHGNPIKTSYNSREPQHDIIRINHYATKSKEEYKLRKTNDRLLAERIDWEKHFRLNDLNDIKES